MLAIIGGTGLYALPGLVLDSQLDPATPFGAASDPVQSGRLGDRRVLFLARHGAGHRLLPHEVNYRANLYALKRAGATHVLGVSAVGSLAEALAPGDLAVPTQYVDWTRGRRELSFFGNGVAAHVSTAEPVSAAMVAWIAEAAARQPDLSLHHGDICYACVEGPRLGTRAESHLLRQLGCQLVGMTNVPEAFLAREAQLAYATIGIVTDYDCWKDDPDEHASVAAIFERYGHSLEKARALLLDLIARPLPEVEDSIRQALREAVMTPEAALDAGQREWLGVLRR